MGRVFVDFFGAHRRSFDFTKDDLREQFGPNFLSRPALSSIAYGFQLVLEPMMAAFASLFLQKDMGAMALL